MVISINPWLKMLSLISNGLEVTRGVLFFSWGFLFWVWGFFFGFVWFFFWGGEVFFVWFGFFGCFLKRKVNDVI